jgi:hypothetical protein
MVPDDGLYLVAQAKQAKQAKQALTSPAAFRCITERTEKTKLSDNPFFA